MTTRHFGLRCGKPFFKPLGASGLGAWMLGSLALLGLSGCAGGTFPGAGVFSGNGPFSLNAIFSSTGRSGPAAASPPAGTTRAAPVPASALLGLSPTEVSHLLGSPSFTRSEAPAQIWQYATHECVLMLFFYGSAPGAEKHLLHIDSRRRDDLAPAPEQHCLDRVRAHQAAIQALLTEP